MTIEKACELIFESENFSLEDKYVGEIIEDGVFYYFGIGVRTNNQFITGVQPYYKISKETGVVISIFLPSKLGFELMKNFNDENIPKLEIPQKYRK